MLPLWPQKGPSTAMESLEHYLTVTDIDADGRVAADMTVKDGLGKEVHQFLLHETLDRTGTVLRLISLRAHVVLEAFRKLQGHSVLRKLLLEVADLHAEDFAYVGLRERLEHDDLVDAVEELRTHGALEDLKSLVAAVRQHALTLFSLRRKPFHIALDDIGSDV